MNLMAPSHAKTRTPGLGAAWAVLIGTGATSVTYNVVHAAHVLELALALLTGFMPAFVAACLSHLAAVLNAPWWVIAGVLVVTGAGMTLSASATASVVGPAEPDWRGWLFGLALDAAALLALWAILNGRKRKAEAEAAADATLAEARAAIAAAAGAARERDEARSQTEAVRAELGAELDRVRGELEGEIQALTSALNKALNKQPRSPRKRAASSPVNKAPASHRNSGLAEDIDTQAEALSILLAEPDISGGELGLRLGKTKRYGCILKNKLAASMAGSETQD